MIYADYNATKPCKPTHLQNVAKLYGSNMANPSSIHKWGRLSYNQIENYRASIAQLFSAESEEIYFCSGATEANNWVINSIASGSFA